MSLLSDTWIDNNKKYLTASVEEIKLLLKKHIITAAHSSGHVIEDSVHTSKPEWKYERSQPTLETICNIFGLSKFERSVLLLAAGVELDSEIAELCAKAHGNPNNVYPSFGLALAIFPEAHWSAINPAAPLRRFRLIELSKVSPMLVVSSPIQIEERVLHYLTGVSYLEKELQMLLKPVIDDPPVAQSHKDIVRKIVSLLQNFDGKSNIVQLWGIDKVSKLAIARQVCAKIGLNLWQLNAELFSPSTKQEELDNFANLWTRESALLGSGLYISAEGAELETRKSVIRLLDYLPGPLFIATREAHHLLDNYNKMIVVQEVRKPGKQEQRLIWESSLGESLARVKDDGTITKLVSQFDLSSSAIKATVKEALSLASSNDNDDNSLDHSLWEAARAISRPQMAELAQQIMVKATRDDLILPNKEKKLIDEIAIHVAQRYKVYQEWGFESVSSGGLGITALFSGASGTGKTMAAEALASALHLDLFRIDLSMVVSKYIGETEKNLGKIFDAAEEGGAILFFDEADALFGKRSEVKDSHDRYANIEVAYLLQRMETHRGLAVLATNRKDALDQAFMRRIRFIVNFPFPDEGSREEIWRHVFPKGTPTDGLNMSRLARLNITGGQIHNIAMHAAFLAADEVIPVNMNHLKRAAQTEYAKIDRPLIQAELGDWH